jgi:hypothetical protein
MGHDVTMYLVEGKSRHSQPVSLRRETRKDAVLAAVDLIAKGLADVTITDHAGLQYRAADLGDFFSPRQGTELQTFPSTDRNIDVLKQV